MSSSLYTKSVVNKGSAEQKQSSDDSTFESKATEVESCATEPKSSEQAARESIDSEPITSDYNCSLDIWQCPKCCSGLRLHKGVWSCKNKHSFDRARQGYTNLLLANKKSSSEPGDNREMIDARRRFLRKDFYAPLVQFLRSTLFKELHDLSDNTRKNNADNAKPEAFSIVDLGCGEGYYLETMFDGNGEDVSYSNLNDFHNLVRTYSIDISKIAVQRAAAAHTLNLSKQTQTGLGPESKETNQSYFAVASNYDIPLFDDSVDIALAIFSPVSGKELDRILSNTGCFIRVSPGPRHFYQLKEKLYDDINLHEESDAPEGFALESQEQVCFELNLSARDDIENLLAMTPLNWHGNIDAKNQLLNESNFTTECDFTVQVFRREKDIKTRTSKEKTDT